MQQPPLTTIALLSFNRLELFKQSLASAQAQTYPNLEIIIFDDHSTDGAFEHAQKIATEDPRIQVIRRPKNIGLIESLCQLLQDVHGKYLLTLSNDDLLEPFIIENAVTQLEKNENISLYVGKGDMFYGIGTYAESEKKEFYPQNNKELISGREFIKRQITKQTAGIAVSMVYRVSQLRAIGGFAHTFAADTQSQWAITHNQLAYIDNILSAHYRWANGVNTSQTCYKEFQATFDDLYEFVHAIKQTIIEPDMDQEFLRFAITTIFNAYTINQTVKLLKLSPKFKTRLAVTYFDIYSYIFYLIYRHCGSRIKRHCMKLFSSKQSK